MKYLVFLIFGLLVLNNFANALTVRGWFPPSEPTIASSERISISGAKFILDRSIPALDLAYRDPSGLIWGSVAKQAKCKTTPWYDLVEKTAGMVGYGKLCSDEWVLMMDVNQAAQYCEAKGVRLPTENELIQLRTFLSVNGKYSPDTMDGKTTVIPGLFIGISGVGYSTNHFWSQSVVLKDNYGQDMNPANFMTFDVDTGLIGPDRPEYPNAVRCVGGLPPR